MTRPAKRIVTLLIFALVVHLFVLPQIGGARKALSVLDSVSPLLIVVAVILEGLALLAYALGCRWPSSALRSALKPLVQLSC